ncbi:MAG: Bro-N domain-containing protein [Gammaproteobacteria bacterium]|nr:Bro-N domain-containing protein [Gammaproteobacteria bacterium]MBU1775199.1 Bro-N domain-containing protein [Gammaproteobacteria bacterium]MBU1968747.1 Bro-N domain-containing protein [Gammaproteobacteria bacterium]
MNSEEKNRLAVFEGKQIRKVIHEGEWWFSIIDVVESLVRGDRPRKYWNDLKKKLIVEGYIEVSEKIGQLKMAAPDGKQRLTDCANTETLFRIIQSIPSPKVEPLKRWLAKVGKERLDEIENPELAMGRMQDLYEKKGYPKEWIDKRLRGIAVRQDLTDEWKERGAASSKEFAILTNEIMQGTFDLKVDEYKQVKSLARENLRDHMTDIELILTMLAEATTTKLHRDRDSLGMEPLKKDAKDGGAVAGRTRKDIEQQTGKPVISSGNFKSLAGGNSKKLKKGDD